MRSMPHIYSDADFSGASQEDAARRLSDLGKLVRRSRRRIVTAAREEDQPSFPKLLAAHLGRTIDALDVVSETWPPYDLVNVQVGLDAWQAGPGRSHELVGCCSTARPGWARRTPSATWWAGSPGSPSSS